MAIPRRYLVLGNLAYRAKCLKVLGLHDKAGRNWQVNDHHRGRNGRPVRHRGCRLDPVVNHRAVLS